MVIALKSFNDVKKDLRQMFMERGWGIEIEGETLPYYKVYTAMLEFIDSQFYEGQEQAKQIAEQTAEKLKVESKKLCPKCKSGWIYYIKTKRINKCRKCGAKFKDEQKRYRSNGEIV